MYYYLKPYISNGGFSFSRWSFLYWTKSEKRQRPDGDWRFVHPWIFRERHWYWFHPIQSEQFNSSTLWWIRWLCRHKVVKRLGKRTWLALYCYRSQHRVPSMPDALFPSCTILPVSVYCLHENESRAVGWEYQPLPYTRRAELSHLLSWILYHLLAVKLVRRSEKPRHHALP